MSDFASDTDGLRRQAERASNAYASSEPADSVRWPRGVGLSCRTTYPRSRNVYPGTNGCHEPPSDRATPTRSNRKPKPLHVATPPFHDSAVASGCQRRCDPGRTTGSVTGRPSSQTRQVPRSAVHLEHCEPVALADGDVLAEREKEGCAAGAVISA